MLGFSEKKNTILVLGSSARTGDVLCHSFNRKGLEFEVPNEYSIQKIGYAGLGVASI